MLKVTFIITSLGIGGAEKMLLKLLERVDRSRFDPVVISLQDKGQIGPCLERLRVSVYALGMSSSMPSPMAFLRLVMLLRKLQPDVVHTWMYHADLLGGLAGRFAGIKRVIWGIRHTDLSLAANKRSTLMVVSLCARLSHWVPDRILVNSEVARLVHAKHHYAAKRMQVIQNGFDLSRFDSSPSAYLAVRHELGLTSSAPLVGLMGRFHRQKNHLGFVQAMVAVHAQRPDVHFLLAGKDVDYSNVTLVQALDKAGVSQVTHLLGLRNDMPVLMASLDVLASSSIGEAFPNVLGEAMACEVPCAVMDVGDSAFIVGDTGRVARAGDMADLAANILKLLSLGEKERQALGQRARARVAELFEIGAVVRQHEALYEPLINENKKK